MYFSQLLPDIAEGKPSNVGQKRKRQTAFKKVKRPKYRKSEEESDEDDIGNIKQRFKRASKAYRTRKEADDGNMASYERRLKLVDLVVALTRCVV